MATTAHTAATANAARRGGLIGFRLRTTMVAGLAGMTACALVLYLASRSGGYFPDSRLKAGAAAFTVLAVLLALHPPRGALSGPALLAVGSLAALTVWTGLPSRWSSAPDVAVDDFQRDVLYVGLLGLGLLTAGSGRYSRHLVWMAFAAAAAILVAALAGHLYPETAPSAYERAAQFRLSGALGYWNALGALGAMTVVMGAGLAADARSHPLMRGLAAGLTVLAGVAAYLSFSRGAWLAFFAGLAVLIIAAPRRLGLLVTLGLCAGALALALLRLRGYDALTGQPESGAGRVAEGHAFGPLLLVIAVATGALQAVVAWCKPHPEAVERLAFLGRRALAAGGVLIGIAGAVLYLSHPNQAEGTAADRLGATDSWISRQWSDFMNPSTFSAAGSQRLTSARGTRSDLFRVAIDGFQANPLRGDGAGGFEARFAHDRRVPETVRDAHSLYLETLGELGLIGALALVGMIGAFGWAAVVARIHPRAMGRSSTAAASAALAVWGTHCIVDWDWQVPALTGLALILAAALMPMGHSQRGRGHVNDRMEFA